ncbi:MAG: KilA-N domain-containing protein [Rikenellaceae bacterium]
MFITTIYNEQFNAQTVKFKLTSTVVLVNLRDVISAAGDDAKTLQNRPLMDVVAEYIKASHYTKREFDFDANNSGELEVWMTSHCALDFIKRVSDVLCEWCNAKCKKFEKKRRDISRSINKRNPMWFYKGLLKPRREDYVYQDDDAPEGLVQTFNYNFRPISICVTDDEVLVNANQIVDLRKKDCSEWFDLESTKELSRACQAKGHTFLCSNNYDRSERRISPVWVNIAVAEDLSMWLMGKPTLKLWMQNRAEELCFFNKNADYENISKADKDEFYISSNCKIGRV